MPTSQNPTSQIPTHRRYCLLKSKAAATEQKTAIALQWMGKQLAESGADLPSTFPLRSRLTDAQYYAAEDLDGTDEGELVGAGFTSREAQTILKAYAEL